MTGIINRAKTFFMGKSMLMRFVLINAAVFLTVHIIALIAHISDANLPLTTWIELPPDFITALKRPWTFITYMFTHYDVWHILFNLLWLYCFGIVFLDHFSEKDFSTAYFAGGFAGAIFYLTGNALFPQIYSHGLLGASAAVLSIATATVVRAPNYRINLLLIGPVKIKWIAVACVAIALLTAGNNNIGGHIAHIGGIVAGFIIAYGYRAGWWKATATKKKAVILKPLHKYPVSSELTGKEAEKELDKLLIKIKRSGYNSLSAKEKEKLSELSKKI